MDLVELAQRPRFGTAEAITEREVIEGSEVWVLRDNVPITKDAQEHHHAKARRPDFPFDKMRLNECFDVTAKRLGFIPCVHCGETHLLKVANLVSSAASQHKKASKDALGNLQRDYKTAKIGGVIRCWRTL